ncbi:MAG: hypothetical protein ACYS74_20660, partial [Planctomycetota bacterium]
MNRKIMCLLSLVLALALASHSFADELVIGDFEGGSLDNWGPAWEGSPVLANSTTGVTSGSGGLSLTTTGGYYCLQWNAPTVPESLAGHKLEFDLTMIASEWPVGLWTKVADKVALNSDGPSGWKEFTNATAIDKLTGESTSLDWGRWWDTAPDVVKTYTVDISDYDLTGATWFQINISVQGGDGIGHFYFDSVQLSYEAPTSSVVIGDFEADSLDNWGPAWEGSPVLANSTTGVTSGSGSLSLTTTGGYYCLQWNAPTIPESLAGQSLVFDLTMIASEWPVGLWTKVADKVALNSDGPSGWKEFTNAAAIDKLTGESTSLDWGRWWDAAPDVVKTYSVDISDYDLTGATWFQINISVQGGDGIGHFYFDNVQLVAPLVDTGKSTDTIIGDWEQDMDGWVVGGGADAQFNDHNGVTLGNYSLDIYIPNGDWNQDVLTLDVIGNGLLDVFKVNQEIS